MRKLRSDKEKKEMTNDIRKMNEQELNQVAGGVDGFCGLDPDGPWTTVTGLTSGWLALRSDYKYDPSNEIGQLYNGDRVQIIGNSADADHDFDGPGLTWYTWVYSERLDKSGWVNSRFLA